MQELLTAQRGANNGTADIYKHSLCNQHISASGIAQAPDSRIRHEVMEVDASLYYSGSQTE
jgi:hypothetical protein